MLADARLAQQHRTAGLRIYGHGDQRQERRYQRQECSSQPQIEHALEQPAHAGDGRLAYGQERQAPQVRHRRPQEEDVEHIGRHPDHHREALQLAR